MAKIWKCPICGSIIERSFTSQSKAVARHIQEHEDKREQQEKETFNARMKHYLLKGDTL